MLLNTSPLNISIYHEMLTVKDSVFKMLQKKLKSQFHFST